MQNHLRAGKRILTYKLSPYRLYAKNHGRHGWTIISRFATLKELTDRLLELGNEDKTMIYKE